MNKQTKINLAATATLIFMTGFFTVAFVVVKYVLN